LKLVDRKVGQHDKGDLMGRIQEFKQLQEFRSSEAVAPEK
jgi:hypothetical protein